MERLDQYLKALLSRPGMKWNDHMSHRDEKWDGQKWGTESEDWEKTECVVLSGIFQGGKWSRTPFQLHSPRLTLCMQRMKLWRQTRRRVGASKRQDSLENKASLYSMWRPWIHMQLFNEGNEPNRQNHLHVRHQDLFYNHSLLTQSRIIISECADASWGCCWRQTNVALFQGHWENTQHSGSFV